MSSSSLAAVAAPTGSSGGSAEAAAATAEYKNERDDAFLQALEKEERAVLRDCLYSLQGIPGHRIQWNNDDDNNKNDVDDGYYDDIRSRRNNNNITLHSPALLIESSDDDGDGLLLIPPNCLLEASPSISSRLGSGARDALALCGQMGWLFQRLHNFVQEEEEEQLVLGQQQQQTTGGGGGGSIVRALRRAVARELELYQTSVTSLEGKVTNVREIVVAIYSADEPQLLFRLKTLALVVHTATDLHGPDLLTGLFRHARGRHGDTRHVPIMDRLLTAASKPWLELLQQWATDGTLLDPAHEFFVRVNEGIPIPHLWREGYHLDRSKVPVGILDPDLVDLVYIVGKGVNYIRKCLQDGEWSLNVQLLENQKNDKDDDESLRGRLERSQKLVQCHILDRIRTEHHLLGHLFALKQFLLLGQGDFFSSLMDGIHMEYQHYKGIIGVYRHNLAAIVEASLQSTNASSFADHILERLQVELLLEKDHEANFRFAKSLDDTVDDEDDDDERTVWDIFLLEYTVPDPLVAIVHPDAMNMYQRLFRFLFGLKKVEYLLDHMWRQSSILQRALHSNAQHLVIKISNNKAYAQAIVLLRQVAMARQSMMHFVCNVKSYLMFEVLEGAWKRLVPKLEKAKSLDEIIQAHESYLHSIFRKTLLRVNDEEPADELELEGKLEGLLALASDFCTFQEDLFVEALEAAERAAEKRREAELLAKQGSWGFDREREAEELETCFGLSDTSTLEELDSLTQDFNEKIFSLLQALDSKLNGKPAWEMEQEELLATPSKGWPKDEDDDEQDDLDSLRFFASQLDHNKYYGVSTF